EALPRRSSGLTIPGALGGVEGWLADHRDSCVDRRQAAGLSQTAQAATREAARQIPQSGRRDGSAPAPALTRHARVAAVKNRTHFAHRIEMLDATGELRQLSTLPSARAKMVAER